MQNKKEQREQMMLMIEEWQSSNLTQRVYCSNKGVSYSVFHYWYNGAVNMRSEEVYAKISAAHPHLLHPNLDKITARPWGTKEFAIADNQLGIRFQQWQQ